MTDISRPHLVASLPIADGPLVIREWRREDLDAMGSWPSYPFPYERFNLYTEPEKRDQRFSEHEANPHRITLMADLEDQPAIGFLALVEIDWAAGAVGNMGYRLHPDWCGKGLGTRFMRRVTEWCFARGFKTLRLDVSAANARAIRCYVKTGFVETGEFWRASPDLIGEDLEDPRYDFVRPHVRWDESMPQVRFWWMERRV